MPPPWWTSARAWRLERPTGPRRSPLAKPAASISQPAESLSSPGAPDGKPRHLGRVGDHAEDRRPLGDPLRLGRRHHRVDEEAAHTATVLVSRLDHHRLRAPERQHRLAHPSQIGRPAALSYRPRQLRIAERRLAPRHEAEGRREHREAVRMAAEPAVPVAEGALARREGALLQGLPIEHPDRVEHVGDLLAVGADVLDRRGAHRARNAGEALEPGQALLHGGLDQPVPRLAGAGGEQDGAVRRPELAPAQTEPKHQAVDTGVRHDHVRAAPEDRHRDALRRRPAQRGHRVLRALGLEQPAGRTAQSESGPRRERGVRSDSGWPGGGHGSR